MSKKANEFKLKTLKFKWTFKAIYTMKISRYILIGQEIKIYYTEHKLTSTILKNEMKST